MGPVDGPFAELDGKRVKIKRTSLTDPGDGSPEHEIADGKIWILETRSRRARDGVRRLAPGSRERAPRIDLSRQTRKARKRALSFVHVFAV